METYLLDWANLLLRWLHVIVAIAWIGSSFYFVFLDSSLTPPQDEALKRDGVIELEGKRHIVVPDFDRLLEETGDDSDGGMLV